MRRPASRVCPLLALGLLAGAGPAGAACKLTRLAELPVTMAGPLKPVVPAKINGVAVTMIADSGATMGGMTCKSVFTNTSETTSAAREKRSAFR